MVGAYPDGVLVDWLRSWWTGHDATNVVAAIADGTPEHLSLWAIPLLLGMTWKAFKKSPKWGVGAGFMAILVALDSPYHTNMRHSGISFYHGRSSAVGRL